MSNSLACSVLIEYSSEASLLGINVSVLALAVVCMVRLSNRRDKKGRQHSTALGKLSELIDLTKLSNHGWFVAARSLFKL